MPLKVLVVDDATFVRDMVKRALRQIVQDVELFEAIDGARAVSVIKQKSPDLILSDWEMPEMTGEQLLKWLRSQPEYTATPFVMITSRGDRNHVVAAVNAGVSDYICKPFTAEELHRKIHKQLKRIGYTPKAAPAKTGGAFSSLDILTGATTKAKSAPTTDALAVFAKPAPSPTKPASSSHKAYLRLAKGTYNCDIREITLQAINCLLDRPEQLPGLFDQAAVDIENPQGEIVARLNAYVHGISAASLSPDSRQIKVIARFVDQDPTKLEVLSKMIASS